MGCKNGDDSERKPFNNFSVNIMNQLQTFQLVDG